MCAPELQPAAAVAGLNWSSRGNGLLLRPMPAAAGAVCGGLTLRSISERSHTKHLQARNQPRPVAISSTYNKVNVAATVCSSSNKPRVQVCHLQGR